MRTLLISVVLLLAACGSEDRQVINESAAPSSTETALVVTANYPLYYFASRIAEGVDVAPAVILPDIEGDPAFWVPGAEQIQLLQSADVLLLNGAGAESWPDLISIDRRSFVDTSAAITASLIPLEGAVAHQHGPEGEHSHQGTAFTTWLDPRLAIAQAEVVANALIELEPRGEAQFRANMAELERDLIKIETQLAEAFDRLDDRPVLFSHPVYQYLQRRFGINGASMHWEPDEEPSTPDWIELQQKLSDHPATIMLWEDEPLESTARRLSDAGIQSVVFYTSANRPGEGDFLDVMRANAERIIFPPQNNL